MSNSLRARVDRLEASRHRLSPVMSDAIDRPPQETREQWIARKAAEHRGEPYDSGAVNSGEETRNQWIARRKLELATPLETTEH